MITKDHDLQPRIFDCNGNIQAWVQIFKIQFDRRLIFCDGQIANWKNVISQAGHKRSKAEEDTDSRSIYQADRVLNKAAECRFVELLSEYSVQRKRFGHKMQLKPRQTNTVLQDPFLRVMGT